MYDVRCMRTFWQENGNIDSFLLWNGNVRATSSSSYYEWHVCRIKCDQPEIHFCCEYIFFRLFFHINSSVFVESYINQQCEFENTSIRYRFSLYQTFRLSLHVEWILNRWKKRNESNQFNLLLRAELHESQTTGPIFFLIFINTYKKQTDE